MQMVPAVWKHHSNGETNGEIVSHLKISEEEYEMAMQEIPKIKKTCEMWQNNQL